MDKKMIRSLAIEGKAVIGTERIFKELRLRIKEAKAKRRNKLVSGPMPRLEKAEQFCALLQKKHA